MHFSHYFAFRINTNFYYVLHDSSGVPPLVPLARDCQAGEVEGRGHGEHALLEGPDCLGVTTTQEQLVLWAAALS